MLGLFAMNLLRPVPGLLTGILIASGLASAALPGATGDVYVVDATGGGDFLDIQSAVDAASQRDTILVRPGNYGGFDIYNKSLAIVADGPQTPRVNGPVFVRSLSLQRDVQLSGLHFRAGFQVIACEATVLFTDCTALEVGENQAVCSSYEAEGLHKVRNSQDVVFSGCSLTGRDGASWPFCEYVVDAADGEPGLFVEASTVTLYSCVVQGGQGGYSRDEGCGLWTCMPACQGDGGHGIAGRQGTLVYLDDTSPSGGMRGDHDDCYGDPPADNGQDVSLDGGSVLIEANDPTLVLESTCVLRENETWTLTLTGPAGAAAWVVWSAETDWRYLGLDLGILHLRSSQLTLQALGSIPVGGVLTVNLPAPALPGTVDSLRLFLEPFALSGGRRLGNVRSLVVIDSAF
jgi:hypothetical protein